jgi:hypothetical protein
MEHPFNIIFHVILMGEQCHENGYQQAKGTSSCKVGLSHAKNGFEHYIGKK